MRVVRQEAFDWSARLNARSTRPLYLANTLDRPRLYRQFNRWREHRAVVILAPAGYGKTSLVSRWVVHAGLTTRTAWLSLHESDDDPHEFAHDLAAALDRVIPGALALTQPILDDRQGDVDRVLRRLLSACWDEVGSDGLPTDQHTLLVLDDLHRVRSAEVDAAIMTLLEHGPDNLHLVLTARPPTSLPLARLYTQARILFLDARDLRFTADEVREYLQRQGIAAASGPEVTQLTERTEGWIAGLQLAVLALRDRRSVSALVETLHGGSTWVSEYLTGEVLRQQTPEVRRFLLQTSLLEELNAPLCAAVTGDDDTYARLDEISRAGLFLIPLDESRKWFRYHRLFQELLQDQLRVQTTARQVVALHRRAAIWLAKAGDVTAAVRHFLAAHAGAQAATLVESKLRVELLRAPYRARSLLALLPERIVVRRPQLMLDRCRLALLLDDKRIHSLILDAEHILQEQRTSDPNAARRRAELLVLKAGASWVQRDLAATADLVRQAQPHLSQLDGFHRGTLHFLEMQLHGYAGKREEMAKAAVEALAAFERADAPVGTWAIRRELARWSMAGGDSCEATRRFKELLDGWNRERSLGTDELALVYFFAAENSYWQDQVADAQAYQRSLTELAVELQEPELIHLAHYLGQALGVEADGGDGAAPALVSHLSEVRSPAVSDFIVDCRTRFLVGIGRGDLAWQIVGRLEAGQQSIPADRARRRLITYLRAYLANGVDPEAITTAVSEALALARQWGDRFYELQLLALLSWQQLKLNGKGVASATLEQAADLARETGYVRVLLDIPELAALAPAERLHRDVGATQLQGRSLLSEQERAVLALLAEDRTYAEIAEALVVSVNTVRTHVRHIYRKLSVHRRDQAVQRAGYLGSLSKPRRTA